ncbi:hypothetical protein [Fibrobacter sp.]|uniref:hypothetical protein n=1 Tax=Fibrobacter sp. TaxID=35828 RepID=UPI00386CDF12
MFKRSFSSIAFLVAGMLSTANALEVRPLAQIQIPGKDKIAWENHGKKDDMKVDADLVFEIGTELLANTDYVRYGIGLAYKSAQKKGDVTAAPATIPVWLSASFGLFNKQAMFQPYAVARFGTLAPLTGNGNWWESPLNYMVEGGAGVVFPYNIGLEVVYDYSSLKKSFKSNETEFRVSSGRVGIQLSVGINLGGDDSAKPAENSEQTNTAVIESSESSEPESSDSESNDSYTDPYAEPEQATGTDSTATSETPSEPTESTEPAESVNDSAATEATEETPSEEAVAETEPAAEETAEAAEPAEPEPEPEAAPAPVEEPKPAATKTTKKSSKKSTKKAAKKSAKKSTKKTSKKTTKKKK